MDLLLEGVSLLPPAERPTVRLHGPDWRGRKEHVRRLVERMGLERWVTVGEQLLGQRKWQTLARAQGFVYPSRWEGFGNSIAEAAAIGVPTLGTPYPLARYLGERGAAFVAPPTASGLADGLRSLTSSTARRVGRAGERVAATELSWDAVSRAWLTQIRSLA